MGSCCESWIATKRSARQGRLKENIGILCDFFKLTLHSHLPSKLFLRRKIRTTENAIHVSFQSKKWCQFKKYSRSYRCWSLSISDSSTSTFWHLICYWSQSLRLIIREINLPPYKPSTVARNGTTIGRSPPICILLATPPQPQLKKPPFKLNGMSSID